MQIHNITVRTVRLKLRLRTANGNRKESKLSKKGIQGDLTFIHPLIHSSVCSCTGRVMTVPCCNTQEWWRSQNTFFIPAAITKMQDMHWLKCLMSHSSALLFFPYPNHGECWLACLSMQLQKSHKKPCSNANSTSLQSAYCQCWKQASVGLNQVQTWETTFQHRSNIHEQECLFHKAMFLLFRGGPEYLI